MPLRKSPTLTPALMAANRRNANKSTGPRTALGKAWSRLNRLRHGMRSPECINFFETLFNAPPCQVGATAQALLALIQAQHHHFLEIAEVCLEAGIDICAESQRKRFHRGEKTFSRCEAEKLLKTKKN